MTFLRFVFMIPLALTNLLFSYMDTSSDVYVVGISGGTGSGKTYIAEKIKETLGDDIIVLGEDYYYKSLSHLPVEERAKANFDHPDSIDFDLLKDHILQLKEFKTIYVPQYDFTTHSRKKETLEVRPKTIILVEGILLFSVPEIRDILDLKVFIDTDDDIRFLRRVVRDINERGRTMESVCKQYLATVYPMYQCYVKPTKRFADVVISGANDNSIAVELLISRLQKNMMPIAALSQ